jgi:hypothetical protein
MRIIITIIVLASFKHVPFLSKIIIASVGLDSHRERKKEKLLLWAAYAKLPSIPPERRA